MVNEKMSRVKRLSSNTHNRVERKKQDGSLPTRHYSNQQEDELASSFNGKRTLNSGQTPFQKGDVYLDDFLIECKTKTSPQESFSIKKDWLEKNEREQAFMGKPYTALAFNFQPNGKNYYVIDEYLFQMLLNKQKED